MILDGTLKDGELKAYEDLGNGWVEEIDTNKTLKSKLIKENTQLKEQVAYLRRSCERKEETIYEQYDELVGLDTKIDKAIEYISKEFLCYDNESDEYVCGSKAIDILQGKEVVLNEVENLQQENKQLKDNWNKLKEWASNFYNSEEVGWAGCGMRCTLEKILELENGTANNCNECKGSDSGE